MKWTKNNLGMEKIISIFLVVLISVLIIAGLAYAYRGYIIKKNVEKGQNQDNLIGGQTDEHGCLIPAGYSWCEEKQKCLRTWEESCSIEPTDADVEGIKEAFMEKYGKNSNEVQVVIDLFSGNYARGGVRFAPIGQPGEGGIFLAYKEEGVWKLAFDGNGFYDCSSVESYGFPEDMIPDCASRENAEISNNAQISNPASVYCQEQGGQLEIRERKIGQYGVCLFEDNRQCEEWALFRGQCPIGGLKITGYENDAEVYCAITGGQVESLDAETPMCKRADGTYCNAQANFDGYCPDPNDPNPNAGNKEF